MRNTLQLKHVSISVDVQYKVNQIYTMSYTIAIASYGLAYIKYHKTGRKIKICTFSCLNKSIINIELEAQKLLIFYTPNLRNIRCLIRK